MNLQLKLFNYEIENENIYFDTKNFLLSKF